MKMSGLRVKIYVYSVVLHYKGMTNTV